MPQIYALLEIIIISLSIFALARKYGATFAESISYGIVGAMMLLSFVFQLAFIIGAPKLSLPAEAVFLIFGMVVLIRHRKHLAQSFGVVLSFLREHPGASTALSLLWMYLAAQALLLLPGNMQGLFFNGAGEEPIPPLNGIILHHIFLRWGSAKGVGIFGFLSYMSIGFSTYALCRRYAWPQTAFTITLVVMSMPRLVIHSTTPGGEIFGCALGLFSLLAANRAIEQPNRLDLWFLISGILFGIAHGPAPLIFRIILLVLSGLLLFRRHGLGLWMGMLRKSGLKGAIMVIPWLVFSQCWLFIENAAFKKSWLPSPVGDAGGVIGGLANLVRYIFESLHLTKPVDYILKWTLDVSPVSLLQKIYDSLFLPIFAGKGTLTPFSLSWVPGESLAWFGPFGFFLILPGVAFALVRGHRRLKALAIALFGYVYVVSLILPWQPGNGGLFTVFFVCGGVCAANFLPPWRLTRMGKRTLRGLSILLLLYAAAFNIEKPLLDPHDLLRGARLTLSGDVPGGENALKSAIRKSVWNSPK